MKNIAAVLLIAFILATCAGTNAADTKVSGRLYSHWMMDLSEGAENFNEFQLTRAYIDIRSKLSEYTSVRITTDFRVADVDGSEVYNIILKYAHLDWKPAFADGIVALRFGLQPTPYIDMMNKLWGRRYLEKTVGDSREFLTTSDLGAGLILNLDRDSKLGFICANIWNGTKYTDVIERNNSKDISGFLHLRPLYDNADFERTAIQAQAYVGTRNVTIDDGEEASDWDRALFSFGGLLAYRNTFDLGADINLYSEGRGPGIPDRKRAGYSFFGTIYLADVAGDESPLRTLNLFGRVDMYDPNTELDDNNETLVITGIECAPVKGFKASVNWRHTSYQGDLDSQDELYLNTLFEF